jgi:putative peptidoglycan lipid II flippase
MTTTFRNWNTRNSNAAILIGLTLLAGGLFKISSFVREAFIAARFGLSAVTDAYFGLQQFPLTLATFMFGAFALAFTPAYAEAKRRPGAIAWMPGLLFYGSVIGTLLTLAMLLGAPVLTNFFATSARDDAWEMLAVLSLSFVPIIYIGLWSGICTARGSNFGAMIVTGLPYVVMTLTLFLIYFAGALGNQSLALSMTAGFMLVGTYGFVRIVWSQPGWAGWMHVLMPWRLPEFRRFLRHLMASSIENAGYAANQLFILYFLTRTGTGTISANNCAMRIGMLGYSLFAQPLAQLMQARLCAAEKEESANVFRRWLLLVSVGVAVMASGVYLFRIPVIRIVYMRGNFTGTDLEAVAAILPAWIGYLVVLSLNAFLARYFFATSRGATYVRYILCAYAAANLLRFAIASSVSAPWIIWSSVIAEGCAMVAGLRLCLKREPTMFVAARTDEVCS